MKINKPKIKVKATCPELCPKSKPQDMDILKNFYHQIDERLNGIEWEMNEAGCTKLLINIEKREEEVNAG